MVQRGHSPKEGQAEYGESLFDSKSFNFVTWTITALFEEIAMDSGGSMAFLPGTTEGWETLEKVAEEEGLIQGESPAGSNRSE